MSGAEVLGIISSIIAIVDATIKIYAAVADASGLPEAFRDVAKRLPLVHETLKTVQGHLNTRTPDNESCKPMSLVLLSCRDKATRLEDIFKKAIPGPDTSRLERPILAARILTKANTVESLMDEIAKDIQLLTLNQVTKLATEAQVAELRRLVGALVPNGLSPNQQTSVKSNKKQALSTAMPSETPCSWS